MEFLTESEAVVAELELLGAAYGDQFSNNVGDSQACDVALTPEYTVRLYFHVEVPVKLSATFKSLHNTKELQCAADEYLQNVQESTSSSGEYDSFSFLQYMSDYIEENITTKTTSSTSETPSTKIRSTSSKIKQISRNLLYFHHIMSVTKKRELTTNAIDLNLGGVWKDGYPGIVIVEGYLDDVNEYIRRIQLLRWKHMCVRGEQIFDLPIQDKDAGEEGAFVDAQVLNEHRAFPMVLEKYETMSEIARACRSAGLEDLFFTSMKIYN